jgi:Protein of unknown function (DUF3089)
MKRSAAILALALALTAAACGSSTATVAPTPTGAPTASLTPAPLASTGGVSTAAASPSVVPSPVPDDTVWLCKPGLANDPCAGSLDSTSIAADGSATVQPAAPAPDPPIDCFYVYPTVSRQTTTNANLTIEPEERAVAVAQAARFSSVCRVYAPMYRQLTLAAIARPSSISLTAALTAYGGVANAFDDYLANYNGGRGIVFIGHSQGAFMLTELLRSQVDANPATQRQLVSALLMGGNVTVPVGKSVGGDFATIPACGSSTETGCVVAYSSFASTPPPDAVFGRIDSPLNPFKTSGSTPTQVLCVNPAAPGGGVAPLDPYVPTATISRFFGSGAPGSSARTAFVAYPGEFSARCESSGGATWLQIDRPGGSSDVRPSLMVNELPSWGLHVADVNVALGNLVDLVRSESAAYG